MSNFEFVSRERPWLTPTEALSRGSEAFHLSPDENPETVTRSIRYGFRIGPLRLMVAPSVLNEVLQEVPVYGLPGSPPWIAGLLNLRGNLVPVFDLHRFFGLTKLIDQGRNLLALDRGAATACVYVDDLPERVTMERQAGNLPPMPTGLKEHVGRGFSGNGSIWMEFSHASFFRSLASAQGGGVEQR